MRNKNVHTLIFLLVKNIGKDFLDLKSLITKHRSSSNDRPLNLLYRFADSYGFLKVTIKMQLYLKVGSLCVHWPWIFSKICQKSFSLSYIYQIRKFQVLAFINVRTTGDLESFEGKMEALSIFNEMSVVFASERDIFCYIFQNICRAKLILIHENIHDIITNTW